MTNDPSLDFSFSGLKTALLYAVRELGDEPRGSTAAPTSRRAFSPLSSALLVTKLRRGARAAPSGLGCREAAGTR